MGINARGLYATASDAEDPAYAKGNWYHIHTGNIGASAVIPTGYVLMLPFRIRQMVSIQALAGVVGTLAAGGNLQFGIYAAHANTLLPTGAVKARTGNISTAAVGAVSAVLPAIVTLPRGIYWWAIQVDAAAHNTLVMSLPSAGAVEIGNLVGASTLASLMNTTTVAIFGRFAATTFGTWPDLTGVATTENAALNFSSGAFQVAA